jgi:hypothetical protein
VTVTRNVINAYLKGLKYIMNSPSWKYRRRYILASFCIGSIMLLGSTIAVLMGNSVDARDLIAGGVTLITLILTSYIFGAVWEDKALHKNKENTDG